MKSIPGIDVLCVGMATYDLTFAVEKHPELDEKSFASDFLGCGGGPAANASVTVSRLGGKACFIGYLGNDIFGQFHYDELIKEHINCDYLIRNKFSTRLSIILAKPNGDRTVITYQNKTPFIKTKELPLDLSTMKPKSILFDGHEPEISLLIARKAKKLKIPIILDAGSVHKGSIELLPFTDFLICSEKFAKSYCKSDDIKIALKQLNQITKTVIITLGKNGLIWQSNKSSGYLNAYKINTIDSTGAGDTFHGAFALGISLNKGLEENLKFAGAASALCCTKIGARNGIPKLKDVINFLKEFKG